jgi:hypothetical protein
VFIRLFEQLREAVERQAPVDLPTFSVTVVTIDMDGSRWVTGPDGVRVPAPPPEPGAIQIIPHGVPNP